MNNDPPLCKISLCIKTFKCCLFLLHKAFNQPSQLHCVEVHSKLFNKYK